MSLKYIGKQKYIVNVKIEANVIVESYDQETVKDEIEKSANSILTSDIEVTKIEVTNIELLKAVQNVFKKGGI